MKKLLLSSSLFAVLPFAFAQSNPVPQIGLFPGPAQSIYLDTITCLADAAKLGLFESVCAPLPPAMHGGMHGIDLSDMPPRAIGYSSERIRVVGQSGNYATPKDSVGAFRTNCKLSHFSYNDPIVYPGRTGAAHGHFFFGNTLTDAFSTVESIATTGNSTCRGGILNRTAYWIPAMIDTRTKKPVTNVDFAVYYKSGYSPKPVGPFKPIPDGLRMIAGDPGNKTASSAKGYRWGCGSLKTGEDGQQGYVIPNCKVGQTVIQEINFPPCWDALNLDSPDHKSHMAYAVYLRDPKTNKIIGSDCPKTHPYAIPTISYEVKYLVTEADAPKYWALSSDPEGTEKGVSSHGDYFMGWKKEIKDTFVKFCVDGKRNCHSNLLGDGRFLN